MISINSDGQALSTNYAAVIRSDSRKFKVRLKDASGNEINCAIKRSEITRGSCSSELFTVGSIVGSSFQAELTEVSANLKKQRISVEIGLLTDEENDVWEYVKEGEFFITEANKTVYSTTITGHGRLISDSSGRFNAPLVKTLARLKTELQLELGCSIEIDSGIDTTLEVDISDGVTTFEALQIAASVVGGYWCDLPGGGVKLCKYKTTADATITTAIMRKLPEMEETDFEITGVRCIVSEAVEDEGEITPAVGYEAGDPINFEVTNEYMTQDLFDALNLIGYRYRPGKIDMSLGDPRLESSDVINVQDIDGTTYRVPLHKLKHIYDGGLRTEFEAVKGTNEDNGIGSKTPFQTMIANIKSGVATAKVIAAKARRIAADTAQYFWFTETGTDTGAHITEIPKEQFLADPVNGGGNLLARSNGIAVRDGLTELATFDASQIQIGQTGDYNAVITPYKFELSSALRTFFAVKDLRGESEIVTTFYAAGTQNVYSLGTQVQSVSSVTVNGSSVAFTYSGSAVTLTTPPTDGDEIVITWTANDVVPVLVFGSAKADNKLGTGAAVLGSNGIAGINATVEGEDCSAFGIGSHAEGNDTKATGNYGHSEGVYTTAGFTAHAEGRASTASGEASHAEGGGAEASGENSHAEGHLSTASAKAAHAEGAATEASGEASHAEGSDSTASAKAAHAEGFHCTAEGLYSHAGGLWAVASGDRSFAHGNRVEADDDDQFVIGQYNETGTGALFVIGNGSFSTRKNAMTVDSSGNVVIAGQLTQASDRRLKEHKEYLGEEACEFIRALKPAHYIKDDTDQLGFYAQDVKAADEWGCMTGEANGYLTMSYTELIAPLVTYCQALERRVNELEATINDNKND